MPAERCFVGAVVNGSEQFYQRDTEVRDGTKYIAKPYFVLDRSEATTMSEAAAKVFVTRLRSLGVNSAWLEDARDGRRIEFASNESPQPQFGDTRKEVRATLDDDESKWYKVIPVNRPDGGAMWLLKCLIPGVPDPQLIYAKDPLSCLQRAMDLNFLQHGERAPAPEPQAPATRNSSVVRRRPGDQFYDQ
jgi:hypothetical protein